MIETNKNLNSLSLLVLTIIACSYTLALTKSVFMPLFLAFYIYFSLRPIPDLIAQKFKVSVIQSKVIFILIVVALIVLISVLVSSSIHRFTQDIGVYEQKLTIIVDKIISSINSLFETHIDRHSLSKTLSKSGMLSFSANVGSIISEAFGHLSLTILILTFLGLGSSSKKKKEKSKTFMNIENSIAKYSDIKTLLSLLTAFCSWMIMALAGLDLATTFAVAIFFLNFIPNIGSLISTLLPIPLIYLQFGVGPTFFMIIIGVSLLQFFIGNILEPKLMGDKLGLHPITVLLSLILWSLIWGIWGMFLSVPLTMTIKIIMEEFEETQKLANLLESGSFSR